MRFAGRISPRAGAVVIKTIEPLVFEPRGKLTDTTTSGRAPLHAEPNAARTQQGDAIDRSLMLRVAARDRAAFTMLANRHAATALGVAQRIVRNAADAEEVVQESLTRLWVFADRWDPDTARFTSWFYRIVTNQAISRVRRKTTESIDAIDEPLDSTPGPHDQLAGREIGAAINAAISKLPQRQRAAIALCYDQGLSCSEAADAMGVSVGTMESLLFRARRSLRDWLLPLTTEFEEGS
jgi:RNA polymerase sigma-70 factor (ECF subfamily)